MKNKFWIVVAIVIAVLCLCAGLAACDDPSGPPSGTSSGCKHNFTYYQFSDMEHIKQCSKCNFNEHEGHSMRGDTCTLCGYREQQCDHPYFYYNPLNDEYHTAQCGNCPYSYNEKHTFANGRCEKCQAEQVALVRKIGDLYYTLNADNHTAAVGARSYSPMTGWLNSNVTGAVTVPATVTYGDATYTVTSVSDEGFNASSIKEITLPDTVTVIGNSAFSNCSSLTKVTLPQNLQEIGSAAFGNSTKLTSVTIPASVTEMGQDAFVTNVKMTIYCEAAQQPEGFHEEWCVTELYYVNFATVVWNVAQVGSNDDYDYAVMNDDTVTITKYKGEDVNLVVPATIDSHSVTAIIERACYMNNSVKTVTLPSGLVSIGTQAFYSNKLYYIDIPATVQNVDESVVNDGIAYFECGEDDLSEDVRNQFGAMKAVYNSGTEAVLIDGVRYALNSTNNTAQVSVNNYSVESDVVIPREVTHGGATYTVVGIKDFAFYYTQDNGRSKINSVYIPETVVNFGDTILASVYLHGAVLYCKGEISEENAAKIYGGGVESVNAVSNAVYDQTSKLWYSIQDGKAVVARQPPAVGADVVIPATITVNGTSYDVTEISAHAFNGRNNVVGVTVGSNVTQISAYALSNITPLKTVEFASGSKLQSIGEYAFVACTKLQKVHLPESLTSIELNAFHNCNNLAGLYITDLAKWCDVELYGEYSNPLVYAHNLYVNNSLVNVLELPASVTEISGYAFYGFGGTEVRLHKNVATIGRYAFSHCANLQKLSFASDTTALEIKEYAFNSCSVLSKVTIPVGVSKVDAWAFGSCPLLIVYCDASIPSDAYYPNGWSGSWIGDGYINRVVWNCNSNKETLNGTIYLEIDGVRYKVRDGEAQVMLQHNYVSGNVTILNEVSYGGTTYPVTSIAEKAFENCAGVTGVTIGNNVTEIGSYAFRNCTGLLSVTVADNSALAEIDQYAFYGCSELTTVTFAEHGALETIGAFAFERCYALTALNLPATLVTIGNYAFYDCKSLLTVNILQDDQNLSELKTIGQYSFNGCVSLVEFTIPESVTTVGTSVFSYSLALTVYCETTKGNAADMWDSNWGATSNSNSGFAVVWSCKYNTVAENGYEYTYTNGLRFRIKDGVATVAVQPKNVTAVTIPASVQYNDATYSVVGIDNYAFNNCKQLTTVTFNTGDEFTSIGHYAFMGCESLANITLPGTVTDVGNGAFSGCTSLPA